MRKNIPELPIVSDCIDGDPAWKRKGKTGKGLCNHCPIEEGDIPIEFGIIKGTGNLVERQIDIIICPIFEEEQCPVRKKSEFLSPQCPPAQQGVMVERKNI